MQRAAAARRLALSVFVLLVLPQKGQPDENVNLLLDGSGERVNVANAQNSAWYPAFRPADGVRLWIDNQNALSGRSCFAVSSELQERSPTSNNWAQKLANVPVGKTV